MAVVSPISPAGWLLAERAHAGAERAPGRRLVMRKQKLVLTASVAASLLGMGSARALKLPPPGAASSSTVKLPDGPASVQGLPSDPRANLFDASVDYALPFELPEAIAGFAPELSLVYA